MRKTRLQHKHQHQHQREFEDSELLLGGVAAFDTDQLKGHFLSYPVFSHGYHTVLVFLK